MLSTMQTAITKLTAFFQKRANWNFLLLALVVGGLPFVLRLHIEKRLPESWEFKAFPYPKGNFDIFHYYKGIVLIILTFGIVVTGNFKKNILSRKYQIAMIILVFLILLSSVFSEFRGYSFLGGAESYQGVLVWFCYIFLIWMASSLSTFSQYIRLMYIALFAGVVLSVIGILQFFRFDIREAFEGLIFHTGIRMKISENIGRIVYSLSYNANYYGVLMLSNCLIAIHLIFITTKKRKYYLLFSAYFLMYFNLITTYSRTANFTYLLLLIVTLVLVLIKSKEKIKTRLSAVILAMTILMYLTIGYLIEGNNSLRYIVSGYAGSSLLQKLEVTDTNKLKVVSFDRPEMTIELNAGKKLGFLNNLNKSMVVSKLEGDTLGFVDKRYDFLKFYFSAENQFKIFNLIYDDKVSFPLVIDKKGYYIFDRNKIYPIYDAPKVPWLNRRNSFISGRGILWSQSLPLLKDYLLIGAGADCFPLAYPNNDLVSRIKTFGDLRNSYCTSSHSFFIQIAVEFGVLALFVFLGLLFFYAFESIKLLSTFSFKKTEHFVCLCCFTVVVGYSLAGLLNAAMLSSIINFWVFLGIGIGVNAKIKHQSINQKTN